MEKAVCNAQLFFYLIPFSFNNFLKDLLNDFFLGFWHTRQILPIIETTNNNNAIITIL